MPRYFRTWLTVLSVVVLGTLGLVVSAYTQGVGLSHQIQQERRDTIAQACQASNQRHDHTIRVFNRELQQQLHGPLRREARDLHLPYPALRRTTLAQTHSSIQLIRALVPHQDCARLVHNAVPPR